jgi:hypothetical protein
MKHLPIIIYRHLGEDDGTESSYYYAEVIAVGTNGKGILIASTNNNDLDNRKKFGGCYKIAEAIAKQHAKFWGIDCVGQHESRYVTLTKHFKGKWEDV